MSAGTVRRGPPRCLLVAPPVDLPTHPYPAVVQLATWLRLRGHEVDVLDANIRFFRWAIRPERLDAGSAVARELLGRTGAGDPPVDERLRSLLEEYGRSLRLRDRSPGLLESLLDAGSPLPTSFRLDALEAALNLAFAPTFPEQVETRVSLRYHGIADPFSSASLWRALDRPSLLEPFFADLIPTLDLASVDFVGISVPFPHQFEPCLRLCRAIRRLHPALPLYLGGPAVGVHLRFCQDRRLFGLIDGMVAGDGEGPLESMLLASGAGGIVPARIPGMIWLEGEAIRSNSLPPPTPLADVPVPADVFPREGYLAGPDEPFHRLSLSRGCSWGRCAFCNTGGSGLFPSQRLPGAEAFRRVKELVERGERVICFSDDEADGALLADLARRCLEEGVRFRWTAQTRIHPVMTLEWATLLRRAGCVRLYIGVESFSDRLLRLMRKALNRKLIERSLDELAWAGLPVTAYLIVGLPTETEEEARDSFDRALGHVREGKIASVHYNLFAVPPGAPVGVEPARYGITSLVPPEGADLAPMVSDFGTPGLSRRRAVELQAEFEGRLARERVLARAG